jgi:hypothetical protein
LRQPGRTRQVSAVHDVLVRPTVPRLTVATRRTLDRHIERAMRQRFGSSTNLRHVVRSAALELVAAGVSDDAIRTLLTRSVLDHPSRYTWDRASILTGEHVSDVLTRQVIGWVGDPSALDRDYAADEPRSRRLRPVAPAVGARRAAR